MNAIVPFAPKLPFVELLARSNFSFLQGASHPEELVARAKELQYRGLGLCDVNGLYGVVRGYQAAYTGSHFIESNFSFAQKDFQYRLGSEIILRDTSSLVLMPTTKDGYAQLCRLITKGKRESPKGFSSIELTDILENADDLLVFPLPPWNTKTLPLIHEAFHDRLYLPVCRDLTFESLRFNREAFRLEKEKGLSLFATQRPLMHLSTRKPLHDILTCLLHKTTLQEAKQLLTLNRERYLKPLHELGYLWKDRLDLLHRTHEISRRVQFSLSELRYKYPNENLPAGRTSSQFLRTLCEQGLQWRYPQGVIPPGVQTQMNKELQLISELEYEDYFLTLWDICYFARKKGILHQGRGSAANSIVCFLIGLTAVDPHKMELLFERFISRERGEPPDIDIDFEHERREEVIQYIYQKYGPTRAAMVCNVICYRSRMALRDVCKAMDVPQKTVETMVRHMGRDGLRRLAQQPSEAPKWDLPLDTFQKLLQLTAQLLGFPRHLGIHSGGFVISQGAIVDNVPIEKATMEGRYVVQWNKDDLATLNMMKIDLLSLGMLTAVRKCLDLLRSHRHLDWDLAQIPGEDTSTYQMIQKADTVGTFQIESRAQMSLLPRLKPKNYYDLVVEVAIVRPGPILGGMIHPYLRRRDGLEKPVYAHPALEPILKRTLGVPIFQEQIMQIVVAVAGFTPGEADELRRIISSSWRSQTLMAGLRQRILNGMLNHGIALPFAEQIYKTIEGFSSYGFPESHAASFALITYASCYLKCHHPDIFACGLLNSQPMGFYSPRALVADAQRHGVTFEPLSVQHSFYDYTLEKPIASQPFLPVRVGLRAVYGLSLKAAEALIQEREQNGPFLDISDFIKRTQLPRGIYVRLAAAGAFACFSVEAREALWLLQSICLDRESLVFGQPFQQFSAPLATQDFQSIPDESIWEQLRREYQTKGYSVTHHPMGVLRSELKRLNLILRHQNRLLYSTSHDIPGYRHRTRVRVAGLLSIQQRPPTAKGVSFLTLEDEFGFLNIILPAPVYEKYRLVLTASPLLEVQGTLEKTKGVHQIQAVTVSPLNPLVFQNSLQLPSRSVKQRLFSL